VPVKTAKPRLEIDNDRWHFYVFYHQTEMTVNLSEFWTVV